MVNEWLTGGAKVSELGIFAYCAAMGFVTAATISSFYQWVTSERADFFVARSSLSGMVIGVLPVVGVTLPLFSYGGSSVLTMLIGVGLLMNISMRRYAY